MTKEEVLALVKNHKDLMNLIFETGKVIAREEKNAYPENVHCMTNVTFGDMMGATYVLIGWDWRNGVDWIEGHETCNTPFHFPMERLWGSQGLTY